MRGFHIGGSTPTGGDALEGDILLGKSAFVGGKEVIGSMPDMGDIERLIMTSSEVITIPAGKHGGSGVIKISPAEQVKIIAENIRKDVTILGVTGELEEGIDTSDADAVAGDILNGKTGYVKGTKVTGNIPSQAAKTVTPSASSQTAISAGTYCSGNITVGAIPDQTTGGAKYATTSAQTIATAGKYITSNITLGALSQSGLSSANIISGKTITISNGSTNVWSVSGSTNALTYTNGNKAPQGTVRLTFTNGATGDFSYASINPSKTPVMMVSWQSAWEKMFFFRNGNNIFWNNPLNGTSGNYTWKSGGSWASNNVYVMGNTTDSARPIYYYIFGY